MSVIVIGRVAAARLAVLPFAPVLWLYAWWVLTFAKKLTRRWPGWLKAPVVGPLYAGGLVGILMAQGDLYTRMTGIWVLESDNYFFALLLAELAVGIILIFRLAYKERRREAAEGTR